MKPLKLVVSAFGPYANLQTVDFQELKGKNIFLITGPTGAGKTTIFDAISYALFGEASGSSRSKDSLRSDFALDETLTYVELDFEIRGKQYRVKRIPQQERKKLKGEGTVLKNTESELLLPNGEIVTRVTAVDEKIIELLGITKNQFKQIVMLPQGEFRKLIEADSQERESIFRKIFGTEAFEAVQRKLDDERKSIYKRISEKQTKRDTHVKNIEAGEDELLSSLINSKDLNISQIIDRTKCLIEDNEESKKNICIELSNNSQVQESLHKKIIEGHEINKKIRDKLSLEKEYVDFSSKEEEFRGKQLYLERARKTLALMELENSYLQMEKSLRLMQEEYSETTTRLAKAKEGLLLALEELKFHENKLPERKKLTEDIATLKSYENRVKEYEGKKLNIDMLRKALRDKDESLKRLKLLITEEKSKLEGLKQKLKATQLAELEQQKLIQQRDEKQRNIQDVRDLYKSTQQSINKNNLYNKESKLYEEIDSKYRKIKANYEELEDIFRRGQAGLLARNLREGIDCPVCGSTHHPRTAVVIEGVPTEVELKNYKVELDKVAVERESKLSELSNLNGDIKGNKEELLERKSKMILVLGEEINELEDNLMLSYLTSIGQALNSELEVIKKQLNDLVTTIGDKVKQEEALKLCEDSIIKNDGLIAELDKAYTENYGALKAEEELLLSVEKEIPKETRSLNQLTSRISDLEMLYNNLEKEYKKAQENHNSAHSNNLSCQTSLELMGKNIEKSDSDLKELKLQLDTRIKSTGFKDYEEYNALKINEEEIKLLERKINDYFQNLKSLEDRVKRAVLETKDLQGIGIEQLVTELNQLKEKKLVLEAREKEVFSRINNNKKAFNEIQKISKDIEKDEEKYSVVADLSKTANGDNLERITFERYVLAAYFDEIIIATNLRLSKMAGGRYVLRRKEEKGKGRSQEGLELEVFDNYTGKARHVKTLSGGESFKASLALALGLADVVQSYAGGISIDTMFVDEGFGTLDSESLDNAIQCLVDLQKSGRLVGIISHVPELKERLDVRLEITPAKEGSKVRFVI